MHTAASPFGKSYFDRFLIGRPHAVVGDRLGDGRAGRVCGLWYPCICTVVQESLFRLQLLLEVLSDVNKFRGTSEDNSDHESDLLLALFFVQFGRKDNARRQVCAPQGIYAT